MPHYLGVREFRTILIRTARRGEAGRGEARRKFPQRRNGFSRGVCVCVYLSEYIRYFDRSRCHAISFGEHRRRRDLEGAVARISIKVCK